MPDTLTEKRGVIADDGTSKAKIERAALILFVDKSIEGVSTKSIAAFADRSHMDQALDAAVSDIVRDYAALADEDWPLFAYHLLYMHRFPQLADDGPLRAATELVTFNQAAGRLRGDIAPDLLASMALGVVMQAAHSKLLGATIGALSDHVDMFERFRNIGV